MLALALIFLALFLVSLVLFVLGMINPQLAFFKKRRNVLYVYPGASLIFFICMVAFTLSTGNYNSALVTQSNVESQQKLDKLTEERNQLQNKLDASAEEIKDLTASVSDLTKKNDQLTQDAKESGNTKDTLEVNIEELEKEKDALQSDLDSEKEKTSKLSTELTTAEDKIDNLESEATASVTSPTSDDDVTYTEEPTETATTSVYFENCSAAKAAGAAPVRVGDPGYAGHLDRDGDGVGCE